MQEDSSKWNKIKNVYSKAINEQLKDTSAFTLRTYLKKTYNSETISNPRIKEIVNFIAEQKYINEVPPGLIYKVARKLVDDSMISSQQFDGTNKLCDVYVINSQINKLLNTLKTDNKYIINNEFISCLEYCKSHLLDLPYFFDIAIKTFLRDSINDTTQERVIKIIGAYRQYIGNLGNT